jgi:hypothetical protein
VPQPSPDAAPVGDIGIRAVPIVVEPRGAPVFTWTGDQDDIKDLIGGLEVLAKAAGRAPPDLLTRPYPCRHRWTPCCRTAAARRN